jgi:hypothetical protein
MDAAIARQRRSKYVNMYVSIATDTHATRDELLELVTASKWPTEDQLQDGSHPTTT